jgi:hypothetical protein
VPEFEKWNYEDTGDLVKLGKGTISVERFYQDGEEELYAVLPTIGPLG